MDSSKPIVFYDIASGPPRRTFAPNPWKTRYALNFKQVHYQTSWVELPDIQKTRQSLGAAPNRLLPDGSDFYTLPVIQDQSYNNHVVGDTFDIAVYLDKTYPDPKHPRLIPVGGQGLTAAFNAQVDHLFTTHVMLFSHGMPLNPANADQVKKSMTDRFFGTSWEDMGVRGQARVELWDKFKIALTEFRKTAYRCSGGDGPFLNSKTKEQQQQQQEEEHDGDKETAGPTYADFIVGAWLGMCKATVSQDEWKEFCTWDDGLWGRLHGALEKYATIR